MFKYDNKKNFENYCVHGFYFESLLVYFVYWNFTRPCIIP